MASWHGVRSPSKRPVRASLAIKGAVILSCLAGTATSVASPPAGSPIMRLTISEAKTPRTPFPCVDASGLYPLVISADTRLAAVNAAIHEAVVDDERALFAGRGCPPVNAAHSIYETSPDSRFISASSAVVSALIPTTKLYDGGNEGGNWLSVTVRVIDARRVNLRDLFRRPAQGLKALAAATRELISSNSCDPHDSRFASVVANYRYFALTVHGLAIGFPQGEVLIPTCGPIEVTVPYTGLRPFLSTLGSELVAGVRAPLPVHR